MPLPPLPPISFPAPLPSPAPGNATGFSAEQWNIWLAAKSYEQRQLFREREEAQQQELIAAQKELAAAYTAAANSFQKPQPVAEKTDAEILLDFMIAFADPGVDSANLLAKAQVALTAYRSQPARPIPGPSLPE